MPKRLGGSICPRALSQCTAFLVPTFPCLRFDTFMVKLTLPARAAHRLGGKHRGPRKKLAETRGSNAIPSPTKHCVKKLPPNKSEQTRRSSRGSTQSGLASSRNHNAVMNRRQCHGPWHAIHVAPKRGSSFYTLHLPFGTWEYTMIFDENSRMSEMLGPFKPIQFFSSFPLSSFVTLFSHYSYFLPLKTVCRVSAHDM